MKGDTIFDLKIKQGPKCKQESHRLTVLPCIAASRIGPDIDAAVIGSKLPGNCLES